MRILALFIFLVLPIILMARTPHVNKRNIEKVKNDMAEMGYWYLSDTLIDVNADGREDFIVKVIFSANYPFRLDVVYPDSDSDSLYYVLPNPTYFPKEKVIRCVFGDFAQPALYLHKYKWNGSELDMIETLAYHGCYSVFEVEPDTICIPVKKESIPEEYWEINRFNFFYNGILNTDNP